MTSIGIDFGTSNCTAFVAGSDGAVEGIPLEGDALVMPSVLFTTRQEVAARQVEAAELERRVAQERFRQARQGAARAAQASDVQAGDAQASDARASDARASDALLRRTVAEAMQREAAQQASREYWDQTFITMLRGGRSLLHGTPALRAYIDDPLSGTLIRSPKSFLGSPLSDDYLEVFEEATEQILSLVKRKAEQKIGAEVDSAVIGRPVHFHGNRGEAGDRQALALIERAAMAAGFRSVSFVMEPVAAAMSYEQGLSRERIVLVLDVGGGTTDCAVVRVGPKRAKLADRSADVLGYSGDRVGGTDFDQSLAWSCFMPRFGKGSDLKSGLPFPHRPLIDAISTRDVPAQLRFGKALREIEELVAMSERPELTSRLLALQKGQMQHRIIRSAELAKIELSGAQACTASLEYVEAGLQVEVDREALAEANRAHLDKIRALVAEAISVSGARPQVLFVTGGMGLSPVVIERVLDADQGMRVETGDMLVSVGRGLGLCAARGLG